MKKLGRPRTVTPHIARKIFLMAGYGMTEAQIAEVLGISTDAILKAKTDASFDGAIKDAKHKSDLAVVNALYKRAVGFEYEEQAIAKRGFDYDLITVRKTAIPDVMACMYWLNNRDRLNWRQKPVEIVDAGDAEKANNKTLIQIFHPVRQKELSRIAAGEDALEVLFSPEFKAKMEKKRHGADGAPSAPGNA